MPLVRNTEQGNNYLEKINTEGDVCARTAIRSYDKQTGSEGATGNTIFSLPFLYSPGTHTLWIYVNGQKAEYKLSGGSTTEQLLEYQETTNDTVTFYYSLQDSDVVEFIVVGAYDGEVNDTAADLSAYKTVTDVGPSATHFTSNQDMGSYKFTTLGVGNANGDSVRYEQLGSQIKADASRVHYHSYLWDNGMNTQILNTYNGYTVAQVGIEILDAAPYLQFTDSSTTTHSGNDCKLEVDNGRLKFRYRVGAGAFNDMATFSMRTDESLLTTFLGQVKAVGFDANTNKITNVVAGTASTDAVNVSQLGDYLPLAGGQMDYPGAEIDMNDNKITNLADGDTDGNAVHFGQFEQSNNIIILPGGTFMAWGTKTTSDDSFPNGQLYTIDPKSDIANIGTTLGARTLEIWTAQVTHEGVTTAATDYDSEDDFLHTKVDFTSGDATFKVATYRTASYAGTSFRWFIAGQVA